MKKILYLNLKKHWFDLIKAGKKRLSIVVKPYWTSRLFDKHGIIHVWDEVHFRNGYGKDKPLIRAEWKGTVKVDDFYHIHIGELLL